MTTLTCLARVADTIIATKIHLILTHTITFTETDAVHRRTSQHRRSNLKTRMFTAVVVNTVKVNYRAILTHTIMISQLLSYKKNLIITPISIQITSAPTIIRNQTKSMLRCAELTT